RRRTRADRLTAPSAQGLPVAKKKKVRVAFKKNRQKRARANDLTRSFRQGGAAAGEGASGERIRAKGELSRKRTIVQEEGSGGEAVDPDDPAASLSVDLT